MGKVTYLGCTEHVLADHKGLVLHHLKKYVKKEFLRNIQTFKILNHDYSYWLQWKKKLFWNEWKCLLLKNKQVHWIFVLIDRFSWHVNLSRVILLPKG